MRALFLALAAAAATSQASPPASPGSNPVVIDVIATDAKGRAVENLKAADFVLREDAEVQALEQVRFVKAGAEPGDSGRLFAIYLDDYYVSASNTNLVRDALNHFVDQALGPGDKVAILRPLDSLLGIRMTSDREALHRTINAFEGRRGDYMPRTTFERDYMINDQAHADIQRTQATWSTLNALALHLANVGAGRKSLLLVSEQADPMLRRRGLEALPTSSSVMRTANRANVSIYVLDPLDAAARASTPDEGPNLLTVLADDTDGARFSPASVPPGAGIEAGLRRMVADASAYYLLTYRSARNNDGMFHAVDVSVKAKAVRLRARKGFWAPSPDEIQRANFLAHANDPRPSVPLRAAARTSPMIRPWFGLARGANGNTRVTFVWEPAGAVPGDRRVRTPSRVEFKALGSNGTTVFEGPVRPTGAMAGEPADVATDARAVFEVPPGRIRLEMSIQDSAAASIDTDVRDLLVGDLRAPVAIGTPEVLRARTARDVRALEASPDAVPVASRQFSRAEQLIIRVPVYAPGSAPEVTAKLLNATGQSMRTLTVEQATAPDARAEILLALAGLAPGDYSLELQANSPAGQAREILRFRVTN
jgi:VWFA-related protein